MNFATALTGGQISGVKVDTGALADGRPGSTAEKLKAVGFSTETMATIEKGSGGTAPAPQALAALLIASPDFQRR